jgi:hypothetical protein
LLSPAEKEERRFEDAQRLTLADVQQMEQGQRFHLISCDDPSNEGASVLESFEYKHDHLGEPVDGYVPVHGFKRSEFPPQDMTQLREWIDWKPHKFLAAPDGCRTSDHAGTVRRLQAR